MKRAIHVGADEVSGPYNRPIDMSFRSQVENVCRFEILDDLEDGGKISKIDSLKVILWMVLYRLKIVQVAGIGERINVDQPLHFRAVNDMTN